MRRALSVLMMVVMVLAPCAVVHAASMKSAPHMIGASGHSHSQHVDCHPTKQNAGHSVCSGDCETLQRVAESGTQEHSATDFKIPHDPSVLALNFALVALKDRASEDVDERYIDSTSDWKTILRRTGRLRL